MTFRILDAPLDETPPRVVYEILRIRSAAFVVEQACVYLDMDGRDLDADTRLVWAEDEDGAVLGSIRVLDLDAPVRHIGRVVTAPAARGRGVGAALVRRGIELCEGGEAVEIGAQAHLEGWYGGFGFVLNGPGYLEDRIPHVPMRLEG